MQYGWKASSGVFPQKISAYSYCLKMEVAKRNPSLVLNLLLLNSNAQRKPKNLEKKDGVFRPMVTSVVITRRYLKRKERKKKLTEAKIFLQRAAALVFTEQFVRINIIISEVWCIKNRFIWKKSTFTDDL